MCHVICMCTHMSWKQVRSLLHESQPALNCTLCALGGGQNCLPSASVHNHSPCATDMASGMISAQHFEAGARSFAALWKSCTDTQQLWTWYDSGNALVSSWDPSRTHCRQVFDVNDGGQPCSAPGVLSAQALTEAWSIALLL